MANQNKLKAYVRYDGTGRVISGSLILQRFKPKVGNWVEIDANECCQQTTTTTTTASPTTTTTTTVGVPFSGIINFGDSGANACSESPVYNSFPVTGNGTTFCSSTELTSSSFSFQFPGTIGYISFEGQYYSILTDGTNTVTVTSSCAPCV